MIGAAVIAVTASAPRALTALASVSHREKSEQGPYGWSVDYSYDGAGNITRIGDQTFGYDVNGCLTTANVDSQATTTLVCETYRYDEYGNQNRRTTGGVTRDIAVDKATNRLIGPTYDGGGNLTSISTAIATYTYTYDDLGILMTEVVGGGSPRTISNVYTADDERLWTYDTGMGTSTMTVRDLSGHVLRRIEPASNGTLKGRDYVYRDGQMLAEYDPATLAAEHFTLDHLGTPRVITNGAKEKIGYHSYLPFGEELLPDNLSAQEEEPKKFTGHEEKAVWGHSFDLRTAEDVRGKEMAWSCRSAVMRCARWSQILPANVPAPPVSATDTTVAINVAHVTALRTYMDQALNALGVAHGAYAETISSGTTPIRASHFTELQVRAQ